MSVVKDLLGNLLSVAFAGLFEGDSRVETGRDESNLIESQVAVSPLVSRRDFNASYSSHFLFLYIQPRFL